MVNLATFDLNLLRVLDALLREGSTVGAARRLGLSQPAVSASLNRLRATLGDELFFRRGRGLEATDRARSLEIPLRATLDTIAALLSEVEPFDPLTADRRFRLSGSDFFAELLMPSLAAELARIAPGVVVHLVDLVPDGYVDTIERYDIDLALIPRMPIPDWMAARTVFHSDFVVIARRDHPEIAAAGLAPGSIMPLDLFCAQGHVLFSPEGKRTGLGDQALSAVGRERRVMMTLPAFSGVYRAVAGSDMIALLPEALARRVADQAGLAVYRAPMPVPRADIVMVWHRRHSADPGQSWLRDCIARLLAPLDASAGKGSSG